MSEPRASSPWHEAWRRFRANRPALVSAVVLAVLLGVTALWPWLAPFRPEAMSDAQYSPPGAAHWFGTDVFGRDLLTRVFYGARVSLLVGIVGAGVSLVIGVLWGSVAGYLGGRWDGALMRAVDVLYSLPSIVFVIVLITTLEQLFREWLTHVLDVELGATARLLFLFAGLGAVSWLTMARIVRGEVMALRQRAFVEAGHALGLSHARLLFRHILPNVAGVVIAYLTLTVPTVILYESFLSFLGLGIQPPQASLGTLIAEGAGQINPLRTYWWLLVCPGGVLAVTLLALNFVGDGLRDALDPRAAA
jgi:ABC-type dipeptide/oligopeptide/nickel transport system permease subunit